VAEPGKAENDEKVRKPNWLETGFCVCYWDEISLRQVLNIALSNEGMR